MAITMYGTGWCSDCKRAKQFFGEQRVHYSFVDVDADPEGRAVVQSHNDGKDIIPTTMRPGRRSTTSSSSGRDRPG
jgi:glutaredoxin